MNVREFIGDKKELTAQKIKRLPPGTKVVCYQLKGKGYTTQTMIVKQSGRHKVLTYENEKGYECIRQIKDGNATFCFTEV